MVGVILAGGQGTRLRPLTEVTNKHLVPVYNKLMIEYPIQTLVDMGCREIVIITGGEHIGGFAWYLGDGSKYGVRLTYRVQTSAGGIAQALGCAKGLVTGLFPVILGDNYFHSSVKLEKPGIIVTKVPNPERFGVYHEGKIVEKPKKRKSYLAVTGLYWYDERVFEVIKTLKPSKRGELEITDVNNWYLKQEGTIVMRYRDFWSDMGTFDSLMEVAEYVKNN
jgi:glucose-1-phosphate thymidylyltransferase